MLKSRRQIVLLTSLLACLIAPAGFADKFYPDDPLRKDPDRLSISEPQKIDIVRVHDFFQNTFSDPAGTHHLLSRNINTLGEVPDSSWFTNRMGLGGMTASEAARGPNTRGGPDVSHAWTVIKAKTEGSTLGFVIRDSRGDVYFIKLDAASTPELQTSAEVISTKILYAIGYNVPENYIAYVRPEMLKIETPEHPLKQGEALTQDHLDRILATVRKRPDGTIRVLASLKLEGEPLGGFRYYGTRRDDPNDIIPHEDRRELRAYRVFSAWLNNADCDSTNTLDTYISRGDGKYVQHNLLDFGNTLGSTATGREHRRLGNEYRLEWTPILESIATFGLRDRPWRHVSYPGYPAVGRFEADYFTPERWKPDLPNPAFERMQNDDALWAARIIMQFNDEVIRAIVKTGEISDPTAEDYLARTLMKRRDKIVSYYLARVNPLSDFTVTNGRLSFRNLGMDAGLGIADSYSIQWYRFNNAENSLEQIGPPGSTTSTSIPVPNDSSPYLMARIQTHSPDEKNWMKTVDVYIRDDSTKAVVGIERQE